jgi:hypothetical protein
MSPKKHDWLKILLLFDFVMLFTHIFAFAISLGQKWQRT